MSKCFDWMKSNDGSPCLNYIRSTGDSPGRCKLATRYACEEYQRAKGLPINSLLPTVSAVPSLGSGAPARELPPRRREPPREPPRRVQVPGWVGPPPPLEQPEDGSAPVDPAWVASATENGLLMDLETEAGRYRIVPADPGQGELTFDEAALVVEIARVFPGAKLVGLTRRGDAYEPPNAESVDFEPKR